MTPINEVPVDKFCRFDNHIVYVYKNNFKDTYGLIPVDSAIPRYEKFDCKVFIYKRIKAAWIQTARKYIKQIYNENDVVLVANGIQAASETRMDNLLYIENLDILKSYESKTR